MLFHHLYLFSYSAASFPTLKHVISQLLFPSAEKAREHDPFALLLTKLLLSLVIFNQVQLVATEDHQEVSSMLQLGVTTKRLTYKIGYMHTSNRTMVMEPLNPSLTRNKEKGIR